MGNSQPKLTPKEQARQNKRIVDKAVLEFNRIKARNDACQLRPQTKYEDMKAIYGHIPYYPNLSETLQKNARRYNIWMGLRPNNMVKSYMPKIKEQKDQFQKSGVYELRCRDCDNCYVGQTSRTFLKRFNEHEAAIRLNYPDKSNFAKHVLECNHNKNVSINDMKVLNLNNDFRVRNFMESLYIRDRKFKGNCVNSDEGLCNSKLIDYALHFKNNI